MEQKKSFNKNTVMNIIIIVLCIILFVIIIEFAGSYAGSGRAYTSDEHTLLFRMYDQEYNSLTESVHRNEIAGEPLKGGMADVYAVAHYYENAVLYYAHKAAGNAAQADSRYKRMEEYQENMGEYADGAQEILDYLEERANY